MAKSSKLIKITSLSAMFALTLVFVVVAATISAHAEDNTSTTDQSTTSSNPKPQLTQEQKDKRAKLEAELKAKREKLETERKEREAELKTKLEERKSETKTKLESTKLENCQKREAAINKGLKNAADRRAKQLEMFNKISERTQKFYTDKNLSLENYDVLVTDVNAKKSAAETAVNKLKTTSVDFKCDSDDPTAAVEAYKAAREEVVIAMKEYRTSIKNLITGVKSVAPKQEKSEG